MLIKCPEPECAKFISETANTCPHCGFIFNEESKNKAIAIEKVKEEEEKKKKKEKSLSEKFANIVATVAGSIFILFIIVDGWDKFYEEFIYGESTKEIIFNVLVTFIALNLLAFLLCIPIGIIMYFKDQNRKNNN